MKNKAFTIVELLIVVALLLILIVVALPSSRKATTLAKLGQTRANMLAMDAAIQAHLADWGSVHADANDPIPLRLAFRVRSVTEPVCSFTFDTDFLTEGGLTFIASRQSFYANDIHCPLTSPVAYLSHDQTLDPFGDGTVPLGYDSRAFDNQIRYGGYFSAGPDLIAGDWLNRLAYNPTNGATSLGEFWGIVSDCEFGVDPSGPCVAEIDGYSSRTVFPPPDSDLNLDNEMDAKDLFIFLSDWRKNTDTSR